MSPSDYKAAREKLGLTQAGLAARLGLPRTAVVKREAGDQRITGEAALALRALKPSKTKNAPGGSLALASGSATEHVTARFIIVQRPDKIPTKKGPMKREMVTEYLRSLRKHFPESTLTVAEIAHGPDLWLTSEYEWLIIEELNSSAEPVDSPRA